VVRRLDPGDPSDLEILQALAAHLAGPVSGEALAAVLGVSSERLRVRIGSLVSLGYVELAGGAGHTGGYQLTERGWAELRRRLPTAEG
jgi:DNA-binding IscR family transcriptional regulator